VEEAEVTSDMELRKAEWRLATVWLIACGVILLILVAQSYSGLYLDRLQEAWGWFLPTVMPTLSLVVGVLVVEGLRTDGQEERRLDRRLYFLALGLSAVYLLLVAASVLAAALLAHRTPSVELLQRSNLWLGPVQGLVAAALGIVFRSAEAAG
jgi:hypothetical protein